MVVHVQCAPTSLKKQIVADRHQWKTSNIHISSLGYNLDLGQKVSLIQIVYISVSLTMIGINKG